MPQAPLDSSIAAALPVELADSDPFGTAIPGDPSSLIRFAWASEVHGEAVFERLAGAARDAAEGDYWRLMAEVERATAACLERLAATQGVAPIDRTALRALSATTAADFLGRSPAAYFAWVGPQIDPYLRDLSALQDCFDGESAHRLATLAVEHEEAIIRSWRLLDEGLEAASVPLRDYLAEISRAGIC